MNQNAKLCMIVQKKAIHSIITVCWTTLENTLSRPIS